MKTTALPRSATRFLERVRSLLEDLPDEDREEVLQDLEAHLADLGDTDVGNALGTPEAFVAEFRSSAGLDTDPPKPGRLHALMGRVSAQSSRFAEHPAPRFVSEHSRRLQPAWVWTRGWLAMILWALMSSDTVSRTFPIPAVEGSTAAGFVLTAAATFVSVRANGRSEWYARWPRRILSLAAAIVIVYGLFDPFALVERGVMGELEARSSSAEPPATGLAAEITNIYAYDLDGNPVEVLLYDQNGAPLTVSSEVFFVEESQLGDPYGPVRFATDAYGQPITNQYPLDRLGYLDSPNGTTAFERIPPPRVAFPTTEDPGITTTTVGPNGGR